MKGVVAGFGEVVVIMWTLARGSPSNMWTHLRLDRMLVLLSIFITTRQAVWYVLANFVSFMTTRIKIVRIH